eukprot:scpid66239/ scgid23495/ 
MLSQVMEEMKSLKINGRPYHPQSQGRVERFNQTLANFLRRDLQTDKDWPSRLEFFYYTYNTRSSKALKGQTPFEVFFRRPNFSLYAAASRNDLTADEREFLDTAHMDVSDAEHDNGDQDVSEDAGAAPALDMGDCSHEGYEAEAYDIDEVPAAVHQHIMYVLTNS